MKQPIHYHVKIGKFSNFGRGGALQTSSPNQSRVGLQGKLTHAFESFVGLVHFLGWARGEI